jgi:hypothetical protein
VVGRTGDGSVEADGGIQQEGQNRVCLFGYEASVPGLKFTRFGLFSTIALMTKFIGAPLAQKSDLRQWNLLRE